MLPVTPYHAVSAFLLMIFIGISFLIGGGIASPLHIQWEQWRMNFTVTLEYIYCYLIRLK